MTQNIPPNKTYSTLESKDSSVQTIHISIQGMSCTACSSAIERTLRKQDSITKANIFLLSNSGVVEFDSSMITASEILELINNIGYKASMQDTPIALNANFKPHFSKPTLSPFKQPNLTKPKNINAIAPITQNTLAIKSNQEKTTESIYNESPLKTQSPNETQTSSSQTTQANLNSHTATNQIRHSSFLLRIFEYIETHLLNSKRRLILSLIISLIVLYLSMFHAMFHFPLPSILENPLVNAFIQLFLTLCVMHFGRAFYIRGIKALLHKNPTMDSLVALGSLAGFFYSFFIVIGGIFGNNSLLHNLYFEGVCVILSFIMLGKYIEEKAKIKAMQNAQELLTKREEKAYKILNPQHIHAKEALKIQEVSPENLQKGDIIQVLAHSLIPVDGILLSKEASIDENMLSGESLPIAKYHKDKLYAGTIALQSSLIMQVSNTLNNSTLAKMQMLVTHTLESKAQIAKLADKISGFFVPLVIVLACCSGIFWFFHANMQTALQYFASTLLISCPCALGLATPMAILFANAKANKMGIFFKNAQSLENISSCNAILFDKTGTLTKRDFALHSIVVFDNEKDSNTQRFFQNITQDELLRIAASLEQTSNHIIAQSLCNHAKDMELYKVRDPEVIINKGIRAILESHFENDVVACEFIIGSKEFIYSHAIHNQASLCARDLESMQTNSNASDSNVGLHIYIAQRVANASYDVLGKIVLQEELKPDSTTLIQNLKRLGFYCEIISGDNETNVSNIAKILDISYKSGCIPQDKLERIKALQTQGHKVIMIGDGINDAIALAKADVSIVMATGSEISLECGDIVYFNESLSRLYDCIMLGRATLNNIKQNLGFAFLYNIICIPLAMGIFSGFGIILNPMLASLAMCLSSISVVGNASRLQR